MESDFCSASAEAWTWAAYCKFHSTSSNEGRHATSIDMHFFVMDITLDNDSWELVVKTTGSTIRLRPSMLPKDACCFTHQDSDTTNNRMSSNNKLQYLCSFSALLVDELECKYTLYIEFLSHLVDEQKTIISKRKEKSKIPCHLEEMFLLFQLQ